jgi:hypothetical protein
VLKTPAADQNACSASTGVGDYSYLAVTRIEPETVYEIVNSEIPGLEPSNPGISGLRKKTGIPRFGIPDPGIPTDDEGSGGYRKLLV